jgi:hypothetical protein
LRTLLIIFAVVILGVLSGCAGVAEQKELLTVDFQQGQTLRYKFVSSRKISVDWNPAKGTARPPKERVSESSESMEIVVAYTPVEVDPYGLATIEAACESAKVRRSPSERRPTARGDAAQGFSGKTYRFTVGPTGRIEDYSQLDGLIREIGKKAFRSDSKKERIKEPDMIGDFIATQWFLWDSVSSIEKPLEGVGVGQSWRSQLSVPTPMVMREARDVTYTLDEIRQSEQQRLAVIRSSYSLAESVPRGWPIPYSGRFQMSGRFGFLRGYKPLNLQGQGEELFNIDAGRMEQYNQRYKLQLEASYLMPLGGNPRITIDQELTMQRLK